MLVAHICSLPTNLALFGVSGCYYNVRCRIAGPLGLEGVLKLKSSAPETIWSHAALQYLTECKTNLDIYILV